MKMFKEENDVFFCIFMKIKERFLMKKMFCLFEFCDGMNQEDFYIRHFFKETEIRLITPFAILNFIK